MRGAPLACGLLLAALAWPAVSAGAPAGATALLILDRPVAARAAPDANARIVGVISRWTHFTRSPMTLPVIQTMTGPEGRQWVRVRLPMRPNGATGWVPADAGSAGSAPWAIVIHRGERRAVVLDDGKARASFPIIVGKPSTPTPLGTFFVVEEIPLAPGVTEGPWALATSAHSDVLQEFGGGDGQVALHGTVGMADPLGTFSSHGCIRFAPAAISWIANHVGPGTPVVVTR
jgi:hypothetical protein